MDERFWHTLDELVATSEVVVDRPMGSAHPKWGHISYPMDYGYLANTTAMDGGGIDRVPRAVNCARIRSMVDPGLGAGPVGLHAGEWFVPSGLRMFDIQQNQVSPACLASMYRCPDDER